MLNTALSLLAAAGLFTELVGYWLHILLHSHRIAWLSRHHMIHHLIVYAPNKPQRPSRDYLKSTYGRANLLGIGLEWLAPSAVILAVELGGMRLLGVAALPQAAFVAASLGWGWLMFAYMHDAMHLQGFWMESNHEFAPWFLRARRLHDVHHMDLDDAGFMPYNFGICFFAFDRLFGTYRPQHEKFNQAGLEAAIKRYAFIAEKSA